MELLAYILYTLASRSIPVFIFAIFLCIGSATVAFPVVIAALASRPRDGQRRSVVGSILRFLLPSGAVLFFVFSFIFGLFSLVNLISPHFLDGELINSYGQKTDAKVISREETGNRHNKQPVIRFKVVYKTADGRNVETYFETWDFNIYPPANSVRYPNVGETFRIAYLPSYPTAFLILTDDASPYTKAAQCGELLSAVEEKRLKHEFDPNNADYRGEYEKAVANAADKKCGIVGSKPSRSNDPGALR